MNRSILHARRGGALVITVLVCLAMTGVALVAVTSVNVSSQVSQNQKMLKQAHYIAESAMMVTMQRLQTMGSASMLKERERLSLVDARKKISFTCEMLGLPSSTCLVEVESLRSAPPPAGYQVNQDQPPTGLEVGLLATGQVGQQTAGLEIAFSERRVWALVPVP